METMEAKILLKNLLKRIRQVSENSYEFSGYLTDAEISAVQVALAALDETFVPASVHGEQWKQESSFIPESTSEPVKDSVDRSLTIETSAIEIDNSVFDLPKPPQDRRLCVDFGTAMSKVTFVRDATIERDYEEIEVLNLGISGDQEEVSETMLVSSVFIDGDGLLWFGQMAVKRSHLEEGRKRLDNIKHYLSVEGDGLNSKVTAIFNPTDTEITYGDMALAYLMFLIWTVNHCLEEIGEPRNVYRRFAMPCFKGSKYRDMEQVLGRMLGEAQILADTFSEVLQDGILLTDFVEAVAQLRKIKQSYSFVKEAITEPLGVAGAFMSWKTGVNSLMMVVDVGAGTSDFSLYRMHFDEAKGLSTALEVANSSEGITEAGNYLDGLLRGLILKKAGVNSEHEQWINIIGNLELDLRDYKERLFLDGDISIRLFNDDLINISIDEFLSLPEVVRFGDELRACRDRILKRVDPSFIQGAPFDALALALTGGGASLPMVKALANGTIQVHNKELNLRQTKEFPLWLEQEYPDLESDYTRIAVSLGGARQRIIGSGGVAKVTAGDIKSTPSLGGYYTKG